MQEQYHQSFEGGDNLPDQRHDHHREPKIPPRRPVKTYLIAVALLIIALIIVSAVQDKQDETDNTVTIADGNDEIVVTINDGTEEVRFDLSDFHDGSDLSAFEDLDEAGLIVNSAQGKPTSGDGSESLVSTVVPAADENMVYFATKSSDDELLETFVGIYHYNTVSNRWQRIYKTTYGITDESKPFLRVLARSGEQLVLLKDAGGTSDVCRNLWLAGDVDGSELLLLDLNDPYSGFSQFSLPETFRQQAEAEVAACEAKL